jgi:TonB family protein
MANHTISNRGLLPLGLIVSLSVTLTGFEFMSADIKNEKQITSKLDGLQDEVIYDDFEVEKPEMPKPDAPEEKPRTQPVVTPPVNPVGPIVVSPIAPEDPFKGDFESDVDPIKKGFGDQEIVYDPPTLPAGFLDEFPTYEEFLSIKDKDKRRTATENKLTTIVMDGTRYPEKAKELGIKGIVHVNFQVDVNGKITNVSVAKSIDPLLDQAAINAVSKLPDMIPGKKLDKPVISTYTMPVKFVLK